MHHQASLFLWLLDDLPIDALDVKASGPSGNWEKRKEATTLVILVICHRQKDGGDILLST